ncbi:ComF family protein [Arthrobacter sp. 92]|uniref:ComF family protein n=1 Tax=Arthrobacter sp. 92 TaxID=3418175 RepID=UPI003CFEB1DB
MTARTHDDGATRRGHRGGQPAAAGGVLRLRGPSDPDLQPPAGTTAKHRSDYAGWWARVADGTAGAVHELLALVAPVDCVCCGAEDRALCNGCERQVRRLTRIPFRAEGPAPALMDVDGSVILPVVAAGVYREELAQAMLAFKKHGQGQLESVLAQGLGRAIRAATGEVAGLCLVPVPSSGNAFRRRGFSPVHLLLKNLHRHGELREAVLADALRKVPPLLANGPLRRDPAPGLRAILPHLGHPGGQKGLGRGERAQRVRGSMRSKAGSFSPGVRGRHCLIVDDVLTTGATLAEAARAIHASGGIVRGAVVLAATRPPDAGDIARPRGARTGNGA